ncbi:hypothetical protein O9G_003461 [Rozella allomycis CSF55]|uniref:Uncharacterized protein n=1 Tax=Rozella allomycis (strain CSF55) TaxID=988480 RepID=A0A075AZ00_ROZAC|nr:hypothetical protein O9G_003461 [Rozella allomycis CSF55]|eukprot:EPZ33942.1 hypothetical protein O9G_003461 [Rozella allomycis CSF55]
MNVIQTLKVPKSLFDETKTISRESIIYKRKEPYKIYTFPSDNDSVSIIPKSVKFDSFEKNDIITKKIRIINRSSSPITLSYSLENNDNAFKIKVDRKGKIMPGLSETVEVFFEADEIRYFYERLKIRTSLGDFICVPIHAFPANVVMKTPSIIDFGCQFANTETLKCIKLQNNSDISFEYKVKECDECNVFIVEPKYDVKYIPTRFVTSLHNIYVDVSTGLGPSTFKVQLQGACQPKEMKQVKVIEPQKEIKKGYEPKVERVHQQKKPKNTNKKGNDDKADLEAVMENESRSALHLVPLHRLLSNKNSETPLEWRVKANEQAVHDQKKP